MNQDATCENYEYSMRTLPLCVLDLLFCRQTPSHSQSLHLAPLHMRLHFMGIAFFFFEMSRIQQKELHVGSGVFTTVASGISHAACSNVGSDTCSLIWICLERSWAFSSVHHASSSSSLWARDTEIWRKVEPCTRANTQTASTDCEFHITYIISFLPCTISPNNKETMYVCRIWGFHGGDYEE
jgi:hypothetical protein